MLMPRKILTLLFLEVFLSSVIVNNARRVLRTTTLKNSPNPSTVSRCPPTTINNGHVKPPRGMERVTYTCNKGYLIHGSKKATCKNGGTWSTPPPVCVANGCPTISAPDGPLTITKISPYRGAVLNFTCGSGFVLQGPSTIYCNKTRWNKDPPECIKIPGTSTTTLKKIPEPGVPFSVTYLQPTEGATMHVKPVKTTTSSDPVVVENPTDALVETSSSAKVEDMKTTATARILSMKTEMPFLPVTSFSSTKWESTISTIPTTELSQTTSVGDLTSHYTLEAEESTIPSKVQSHSSIMDDVPDFVSVRSSTFGRMTQFPVAQRSFIGETTEDQSTSEVDQSIFYEDKETKKSDSRVTESHELYPEKSLDETAEKVSTSETYQMTSQISLEIGDPAVSTTKSHFFSSELISKKKEQVDRTPETHTSSSARPSTLEEKIADEGLEMQSRSSVSFAPLTASQEPLTVQSYSSDTPFPPFDDNETSVMSERSPLFTLSSSSTEESSDVAASVERGPDPTSTDARALKTTDSDTRSLLLRSFIVTHLFNEDYGKDLQTTTQTIIAMTNAIRFVDPFTETQTESGSDASLVPKAENRTARGNDTGKSKPRSHSILTTNMSPLNLTSHKGLSSSKPSSERSSVTTEDRVAVFLIVMCVGLAIVLVVLVSVLGKTLLPKCTLRPKPSHEHGAVPYTESNGTQTTAVLLRGITPINEDNGSTQV